MVRSVPGFAVAALSLTAVLGVSGIVQAQASGCGR